MATKSTKKAVVINNKTVDLLLKVLMVLVLIAVSFLVLIKVNANNSVAPNAPDSKPQAAHSEEVDCHIDSDCSVGNKCKNGKCSGPTPSNPPSNLPSNRVCNQKDVMACADKGKVFNYTNCTCPAAPPKLTCLVSAISKCKKTIYGKLDENCNCIQPSRIKPK
jgi:hypothetical protein